jgi:signal transduction histidine kinase
MHRRRCPVWRCGEDATIRGLPHILGDRIQLQQVILNLIMNAVEAMGEVAVEWRD